MALSSHLIKNFDDSSEKSILSEKYNRYRKFENYLENIDFDKLMLRLTYEHNDEYINSCYNSGFRPKPNNKLQFILDYLRDNYSSIYVRKLGDNHNNVWSFKGYFFQVIENGIINVINKDDLTMMIRL